MPSKMALFLSVAVSIFVFQTKAQGPAQFRGGIGQGFGGVAFRGFGGFPQGAGGGVRAALGTAGPAAGAAAGGGGRPGAQGFGGLQGMQIGGGFQGGPGGQSTTLGGALTRSLIGPLGGAPIGRPGFLTGPGGALGGLGGFRPVGIGGFNGLRPGGAAAIRRPAGLGRPAGFNPFAGLGGQAALTRPATLGGQTIPGQNTLGGQTGANGQNPLGRQTLSGAGFTGAIPARPPTFPGFRIPGQQIRPAQIGAGFPGAPPTLGGQGFRALGGFQQIPPQMTFRQPPTGNTAQTGAPTFRATGGTPTFAQIGGFRPPGGSAPQGTAPQMPPGFPGFPLNFQTMTPGVQGTAGNNNPTNGAGAALPRGTRPIMLPPQRVIVNGGNFQGMPGIPSMPNIPTMPGIPGIPALPDQTANTRTQPAGVQPPPAATAVRPAPLPSAINPSSQSGSGSTSQENSRQPVVAVIPLDNLDPSGLKGVTDALKGIVNREIPIELAGSSATVVRVQNAPWLQNTVSSDPSKNIPPPPPIDPPKPASGPQGVPVPVDTPVPWIEI